MVAEAPFAGGGPVTTMSLVVSVSALLFGGGPMPFGAINAKDETGYWKYTAAAIASTAMRKIQMGTRAL